MSAARGVLVLEDGLVLEGRAVAAAGTALGEMVFTTGMTGYQEAVTDPSYAGQLLCFAAPMIGNYGVGDAAMESDRVWPGAVPYPVEFKAQTGPDWRIRRSPWRRAKPNRQTLSIQ